MENNKTATRPGLWWKIVAVFAIAVSLFQGFMFSLDFGQVTSAFRGCTTFDVLEFLVETVIWGITFLGVLLSIIIFGIGSIVKTLKDKT